jgi:hypothetical protein
MVPADFRQQLHLGKGGLKEMSRNTLLTPLLLAAAILLAVALFVAGAIWRGRATARPAASTPFSAVLVRSLEIGTFQSDPHRRPSGQVPV